MSKCQKNKYMAGGRCGGSQGSYNPPTETSSNFSALLAARDAQDKALMLKGQQSEIPQSQPQNPLTQGQGQGQGQGKGQLTIQPQTTKKQSKNDDIDTILQGDF